MAASEAKDPYAILGVARDADEDAIRKAYRKLARELHPDVNPDNPAAEDRFNFPIPRSARPTTSSEKFRFSPGSTSRRRGVRATHSEGDSAAKKALAARVPVAWISRTCSRTSSAVPDPVAGLVGIEEQTSKRGSTSISSTLPAAANSAFRFLGPPGTEANAPSP